MYFVTVTVTVMCLLDQLRSCCTIKLTFKSFAVTILWIGLKEISNLDQCRSLTDLSLANNQVNVENT